MQMSLKPSESKERASHHIGMLMMCLNDMVTDAAAVRDALLYFCKDEADTTVSPARGNLLRAVAGYIEAKEQRK